jgi:hypothetical protein
MIRRTSLRSFRASKVECRGLVCVFTWFGRGKALAVFVWYRYTSDTFVMKISGVSIVKVIVHLFFSLRGFYQYKLFYVNTAVSILTRQLPG